MTGAGGGQTVVSMRCTANQRNIVCQSNYALKAINGAGNDLTRLEKSDLSRDFFLAWISIATEKIFWNFFDFR